ncbi:hypothetical protein EJ04DRAFT_274498 [Polyplosphaeria fusca]|uniref:C2H2-type domain-containing protein n=1 Tax=Polyplosphaeria fusca TaxID=682080 RepID=A0A9P4QSY4_9PLEO|nr:hypothetical protein EJ04DRAFT_274498 [Polyplosphaeria fusca]
MDDNVDIPEESMRHVEALLSRHNPQMIQRMFQQVIDSRESTTTSLFTRSPCLGRNSIASSYSSSSSSLRSHLSSRLSVASTFSTSTASSGVAPSIASSRSSMSSYRRPEPRSYPSGLDPTRPVPAMLTPAPEDHSPLDTNVSPSFTPTEEDMASIASPVTTFSTDKSQPPSGDSFMFCTYCAESKVTKTFKAKSDWKKHEMRMHETGEDWPCIVNGCNRIFDRQKDFLKHHQRYHSGRPLPSLTDIGIRLMPRRVFGCGFDKCKEVSIGWDERCDHVAKHMKNGAYYDQWKYSNVIRNLIRQEALHDTWKDLITNLDERLRESRSQISWCPDNTRMLRQKLQCCDLRPSREDVLIIALSLRSDIPIDTSRIEMPAGFVTPSRDSVPQTDQLSKEQRMQILNGNPNNILSRSRLAAVNTALLQSSHKFHDAGAFESAGDASPYMDEEMVDGAGRRISYMDLDPGDFTNLTQPMSQPEIPSIPHTLDPHTPILEPEQPHFVDPAKPTTSNQGTNPMASWYPNYFDTAPTFEESQYYDRSTLGHLITKPLRKIGSGLGSRRSSPHSRPSSQADANDFGDADFMMPIQHQGPQPPTNHLMAMRQQQYHHDTHRDLHLYTHQG